ncbi:Fc.00g041720.m01.CDS01 [Cosmosporella sp. VM-42]
MAESQPTLIRSAAKVTELSVIFTQFLQESKVPAPKFAADSVTSCENLTPEIFQTRQLLLDNLMDMWYLTHRAQ